MKIVCEVFKESQNMTTAINLYAGTPSIFVEDVEQPKTQLQSFKTVDTNTIEPEIDAYVTPLSLCSQLPLAVHFPQVFQ